MQLKCKTKICAVYGEGAMTESVKSGLQSFVLEISHWAILHSQVDQWKLISDQIETLIENKIYQAGDSQHT